MRSNGIPYYDSVQRYHSRQSFQYARIARRNDFGEHNDQRAYQSIHLWHHDWHRAHCLHVQHQPLNEHIFPDVWLFVNDHSRHYMQGGEHRRSLRRQCFKSTAGKFQDSQWAWLTVEYEQCGFDILHG
jgi:hypothetical protein